MSIITYKEGFALINLPSVSIANTVVLADGSLLATAKEGVIKLTKDGVIDTSFGDDGVVSVTGVSVSCIITDASGKLLIAGTKNNDFALTRYTSSGALDTSFGSAGISITDISSSSVDSVVSMLVQEDGKVVVIGASDDGYAIARYSNNGILDTGFSGDGIDSADKASLAAIAQLSNKKLVAVGSTADDFKVLRYLTDGALDAGFSDDGSLKTDIADAEKIDIAYSVSENEEFKLVVSGISNNQLAIARYTTAGELDTSFSDDGMLSVALPDGMTATNVIQTESGQFIVLGHKDKDLAMARFNTNGTLDSSFGSSGLVVKDLKGTDSALSVVEQADHQFVVTAESDDLLVLLRYSANGTLDTSFAVEPTEAPTSAPTEAPTSAPTEAPTSAPTSAPTEAPTTVNTAPVFAMDVKAFTLEENSKTGTDVVTLLATDKESHALTYSLIGTGNKDLDGDGEKAFSLNKTTGALKVNDKDDINFELLNQFKVDIKVLDIYKAASKAQLIINIKNLDELSTIQKGTSKADVLVGAEGKDDLSGGNGNDIVKGFAGDDVLKGGQGKDSLTGGSGKDKFIFDTKAQNNNVDKVVDFKSGEDMLVLSAKAYLSLAEQFTPDQFISGTGFNKAQDMNDRIIYDTQSGSLYYDADGLAGVNATKIAVIGSKANLSFDDFEIG